MCLYRVHGLCSSHAPLGIPQCRDTGRKGHRQPHFVVTRKLHEGRGKRAFATLRKSPSSPKQSREKMLHEGRGPPWGPLCQCVAFSRKLMPRVTTDIKKSSPLHSTAMRGSHRSRRSWQHAQLVGPWRAVTEAGTIVTAAYLGVSGEGASCISPQCMEPQAHPKCNRCLQVP